MLPALPFRLLLGFIASLMGLLPAPASAAPVTMSGTSAQTLGPGQAGAVAVRASLTVAGATPAVTLAGDGVTLSNFGSIVQTGAGNAVLAENGSGLVIDNGSRTNAAARIEVADNAAIQARKAAANVTVNNYGKLLARKVTSDGGHVVDFGKIGGAHTIHNHAGGEMRATDADALRPGENGVILNAGRIVSVKASSEKSIAAIDAKEHSGIRVTNASTGVIEGARHAITGGRKTDPKAFVFNILNEKGATIQGNNGAGLNFDGVGAGQVITVDNRGVIIGRGVTADGDGIDVDGLVHITNTGTIRSDNAFSKAGEGIAFSEAISAGGGTIINGGVIEGRVAAGNGNAVARAIALVGNDIKDKPGQREGIYADTRVVNQAGGLISGANESAIMAAGAPNDFTMTIENAAGATIRGGRGGGATDQAAVRSVSNRTTIINAGLIDGAATGKSIELGHANNTLIVKGGSAVIRGAIDGGPGGGNTMVVDAGAGKQFVYDGTIARFDTLDVRSGNAKLSGQLSFTSKTVVSGGSLTLVGPQSVAPGSALVLAGGVLHVEAAGAAGHGFASLSLENDAALDTGQATLSFERIGQVAPGKMLTLVGVIRIAGDLRADGAFQALLQATRIGQAGATASVDGGYTQILPAQGRLARTD